MARNPWESTVEDSRRTILSNRFVGTPYFVTPRSNLEIQGSEHIFPPDSPDILRNRHLSNREILRYLAGRYTIGDPIRDTFSLGRDALRRHRDANPEYSRDFEFGEGPLSRQFGPAVRNVRDAIEDLADPNSLTARRRANRTNRGLNRRFTPVETALEFMGADRRVPDYSRFNIPWGVPYWLRRRTTPSTNYGGNL